MAAKTAPKADQRQAPTRWDRSYGEYLTGRSHLDGLDALAAAMERYWGCDRLRLLVDQGLRERFDRQRLKFSAALAVGSLDTMVRECSRMMAAWTALDAAARAAGATPLKAEVWEVALEDGTVACLVQTAEEAMKLVRDDRRVAVYTLEEIGRMLSIGGLTKIKRQWPGAAVTRVAKTVTDPLDNFGGPVNLEDPLDDAVPGW